MIMFPKLDVLGFCELNESLMAFISVCNKISYVVSPGFPFTKWEGEGLEAAWVMLTHAEFPKGDSC